MAKTYLQPQKFMLVTLPPTDTKLIKRFLNINNAVHFSSVHSVSSTSKLFLGQFILMIKEN